jgi:hypothetical protein
MAVEFWSTPMNHLNDAGFQAWATELFDKLTSAGLVQTTDTGQLAYPVVASRPATNTPAGYWIFRFNDSRQATSPIFIKLEVGSSPSSNQPGFWLTVGTGSDGAGALTGVTTPRTQSSPFTNNTATNWPSYVCVTEGFFGMAWKINAHSTAGFPTMTIGIGRSVGSNGLPNDDGFTVYFLSSSSSTNPVWAVSNVTNSVITSNVANTNLVALAVSSSVVAATPQVYKHYTAYPRMQPNPWFLTCRSEAEIPQFNQFRATAVGSVQRNYVALGVKGSGPGNSLAGTHMAMVYE